jgi:hypothetical protein
MPPIPSADGIVPTPIGGRGAVEWRFGDVIWAMIVFYFWFMFIWAFIRVFGDVFSRSDLSGGAKAGWVLLIIVLPFVGILIYLIARPRMTEDRQMMGR